MSARHFTREVGSLRESLIRSAHLRLLTQPDFGGTTASGASGAEYDENGVCAGTSARASRTQTDRRTPDGPVEQETWAADGRNRSPDGLPGEVEQLGGPRGMVELQIQQAAYEAALGSIGRVIAPSLVEFLR